MEGTASFGSNVVSFLLTSRERQWYVVGAYVPPNNVPAMHRIEQVLILASKVLEMILTGDMNTRLGEPRDKLEEDLAMALVDRGVVNMIYQFMPQ